MTKKVLLVGVTNNLLYDWSLIYEDVVQFASVLNEYSNFNVNLFCHGVFSTKINYLSEGFTKRKGREKWNIIVNSAKQRKALLNLFKPKDKIDSDTALFYFSGHASQIICENSELYLANFNANHEQTQREISFQWLLRLMEESPVSQQLVILDCFNNSAFSNYSELQILNLHKKMYLIPLALGVSNRESLDNLFKRYLRKFTVSEEIVKMNDIKSKINDTIVVLSKDYHAKIKYYYLLETLELNSSNSCRFYIDFDKLKLLTEIFSKKNFDFKKQIISVQFSHHSNLASLYQFLYNYEKAEKNLESCSYELVHMLTPGHSCLIREYCTLLSLFKLPKAEKERLLQIIELAQSDSVLGFLCNEINYLIYRSQMLITDENIHDYRIKNTKLAELFLTSFELEEKDPNSEYIEKGSLQFITKISEVLKSEKEDIDELHYYSDTGTFSNELIERVTPKHLDLLKEYYRLLSAFKLSEAEENRLSEILELAETDNILSFFCNEIDCLVLQQQDLSENKYAQNFTETNAKLVELLDEQKENQESFSQFIEKSALKFIAKLSHLFQLNAEDIARLSCFFINELKRFSYELLWKLIPEHLDLFKEYYRLLSAFKLSEAEENRLSEILEIAETDNILSFFCNEIDCLVLQQQDLSENKYAQNFTETNAKLVELLDEQKVDEQKENQESFFQFIEKSALKFIAKFSHILQLNTENIALLNSYSIKELNKFSYKLLQKIIPERIELLREYYKLLSTSALSEVRNKRLSEIVKLAYTDNILSLLCNEIDNFVLQKQSEVNFSDSRQRNAATISVSDRMMEISTTELTKTSVSDRMVERSTPGLTKEGSQLHQYIQAIINKRQEMAKRIKQVKQNWLFLQETLQQLEQKRQEISHNPNLAKPLAQYSFSNILESIDSAKEELDNLEKRLSRKTLNIGVFGRMRNGKSRLLQSLTGLGENQIPSGSGGVCTRGLTKIFHVSDSAKVRNEVEYHSWSSFKEIIHLYFDKLGLDDKPIVPDDMKKQLPKLPEEKRSDINARYLYGRLCKEYYGRLEEYQLKLNGSTILVPDDKITKYITQDDNNNSGEYLAVKELRIFCQFPYHQEVGQIGVIDLPGLGDDNIFGLERLIKNLKQDIDVIIFVRMPKYTGDDWEEADRKMFQTARDALGEFPLSDCSFLVLNRVQQCEVDNYEKCELLARKFSQQEIKINHRPIIANCSIPGEVNEDILTPVLNYLTGKIESVYEQYLRSFNQRLQILQRETSKQLDQANQAIAGHQANCQKVSFFKNSNLDKINIFDW